jgi:hypothetical protein
MESKNGNYFEMELKSRKGKGVTRMELELEVRFIFEAKLLLS